MHTTSGNMLGLEGAKALTPALAHLNNLRTLDLSRKHVALPPIQALSHTRTAPRPPDNRLGPDGMAELLPSLHHIAALETLNVNGSARHGILVCCWLPACNPLHSLAPTSDNALTTGVVHKLVLQLPQLTALNLACACSTNHKMPHSHTSPPPPPSSQ